MEIKPHQITIRQLFEDYSDMGEEGVFGYGEKLNIRPPYQRELVYDADEQAAVIASIRKGFPINVMYWIDNGDDTYELLDGQQRTLSICRYVDEAKNKWCCTHEIEKCLADECMAWRWFDPDTKNEGYCGLAGKEGAE